MQVTRSGQVRWLLVVLGLVAIVAAACGGDGDDDDDDTDVAEESSEQADPDESVLSTDSYGEAVGEINERVEARFEEAFAPLDDAAGALSSEGVLRLLTEALPLAIEALEDGIGELRALEPPANFAADQQLLIDGWMSEVDLYRQGLDAAQEFDFERSQTLLDALNAQTRALRSGLSAEFSEYVFTSEQSALASALFGGLSAEQVAYLDALAEAQAEFVRRAQAFGQAVSQTFADQDTFLAALLAAEVGEAFAAAQALIVVIEPPAAYVSDHELVLDLYEELVRIDREIGDAVAAGDLVGFLVGNIRLQRPVGEALIALAPEVADALFPGNASENLLRLQEGEFGSAYARDLYAVLVAYRLRLTEPTGLPDFSFAPTEEADELTALSLIVPELIALTDETSVKLAALEPTPELRPDHDRLAQYLGEMKALYEAILSGSLAGDNASVQTELGRATDVFCDAGQDLTDTPEVSDVLFGGSPGDPSFERLCRGR